MRKILWLIPLTLLLAACAPAVEPLVEPRENPTETPAPTMPPTTAPPTPTFTPLPPAITPTPEFTPITPTVMPTGTPLPLLTPDAFQVEHWKEYQAELAKAIFSYNPDFPEWRYGPNAYKDVLCEWDNYLGESSSEVYLWASCMTSDGHGLRQDPAVVSLDSDGSIQKVDVPNVEFSHGGTPYLTYDLQLFPIETQEKLCLIYFDYEVPQCFDITPAYDVPLPQNYIQSRGSVLVSHLKYRESHRDELPLAILSAMPVATPTP